MIKIVLAKAIEDPSMLIQPQQHKISTVLQDSMALGSTLKHNIAEKFPTINTQVNCCKRSFSVNTKTKTFFFA